MTEDKLSYVSIHYKMTRWRWYQDSRMVHVFLHILLHATRHDRIVGNIPLKRGQALLSVKAICDGTGLSTKKVRVAMSRLTQSNEIVLKTANKYSIITVCNYDCYQKEVGTVGQTKGKQRANKGQHSIEIIEIIDKDIASAKKKTPKKKYGKFNNVLLTEDEYQKLKGKFNSSAGKKIEDLSYYLGSTGKKYQSHYLTILSWARKEEPKADERF